MNDSRRIYQSNTPKYHSKINPKVKNNKNTIDEMQAPQPNKGTVKHHGNNNIISKSKIKNNKAII